MRAKSLSVNDFLYVSLAFRQANIVAVSSVLAAGDAARLLEFRCPSNEDGGRLFKVRFNSTDESGCDIIGKRAGLLGNREFRHSTWIFIILVLSCLTSGEEHVGKAS